MSTKRENKDLASALEKLGITLDDPRFRYLPPTRVDPLWDKFEKEYHLTLFELLALMRARCDPGEY